MFLNAIFIQTPFYFRGSFQGAKCSLQYGASIFCCCCKFWIVLFPREILFFFPLPNVVFFFNAFQRSSEFEIWIEWVISIFFLSLHRVWIVDWVNSVLKRKKNLLIGFQMHHKVNRTIFHLVGITTI